MSSGAALAGDQLIPYGSAQNEYNSNIFFRSEDPQPVQNNAPAPDPVLGIIPPGNDPAAAQNGDTTTPSDSVRRYVAGIAAGLPWGNQKLRAAAEGRRVDFDQFSNLDHDESLLSAGLDWRLTSSRLDGAVDYRQERRMAAFMNRNARDLTLENERIGSGSLNYDIGPDWRLESRLRSRELDSPLPGAPEFRLKENSINAALKVLQSERLATGVYADYLAGRFEGIAGGSKFQQESLGVSADYSVTGLGRVGAQLGYTQRQNEGGGKVSALTGMQSYHGELTAKTSVETQVFRRVVSYVGGASSVEETGMDAALAWQATPKILLAGSGQLTQGRFKGSSSSGRKDDSQVASLTLTYQMRPWLALRPYGRYEKRDSNNNLYSFDATIAGIEVQGRFQ